MNGPRRREIESLIKEANALKERIDEIQSAEQEYIDNIPENLQYSERATRAGEAVDTLEYASNSLDEVIDYLTAATEV